MLAASTVAQATTQEEDRSSTITRETTASGTLSPAGTLHADVVHSSLGFEVRYMGISLFRGEVKDFDARSSTAARRGRADRGLESEGREPAYPPALGGFFDAEHPPPRSHSRASLVPTADGIEVDGELTIKGVTRPATLKGAVERGGSPTRVPATRATDSTSGTTIDRTEFGLDWNADMPDGTKALSNKVTLKAELCAGGAA